METVPQHTTLFTQIDVNKETITWFLRQFSGIYAFTKGIDNQFDADLCGFVNSSMLKIDRGCPFLLENFLNDELLPVDDSIKYFENAIIKGYCISAVINPHYIHKYDSMMLNEHNILLNGFDQEKQIFYGNDFFPPSYTYRSVDISYKEFFEAFQNREKKYSIGFIKRRKMERVPSYDEFKETMIFVLNNLLSSNYKINNPYYPIAYEIRKEGNSGFLKTNQIWKGLDVYLGFAEKVDNIPNKFWAMLRDSKRLLQYASSILKINDEYYKNIQKQYFVLIEKLSMLVMLNIKYSVSKKIDILKKMRILLYESSALTRIHLALLPLTRKWQ